MVPGVGHWNLAPVPDVEAGELLLQRWGALFLPEDHGGCEGRGRQGPREGCDLRRSCGFRWDPQSQGEAWRGQGGEEGRGGEGRVEGDTHPALGLVL